MSAAVARPTLASSVWEAGEGAWVALVVPGCAGSAAGAVGRERRLADRRAGRIAEQIALNAAGLTPDAARVSRAHSSGAGAAAVAQAGWMVGVDVVATSRVTAAHARAVASEAEIALASELDAASAPAIIWALKEAVAKATSRRGLGAMPEWTIRGMEATWAELTRLGEPRILQAGCLLAADLACAWVIAPLPAAQPACASR